jgi:hypothetical protein
LGNAKFTSVLKPDRLVHIRSRRQVKMSLARRDIALATAATGVGFADGTPLPDYCSEAAVLCVSGAAESAATPRLVQLICGFSAPGAHSALMVSCEPDVSRPVWQRFGPAAIVVEQRDSPTAIGAGKLNAAEPNRPAMRDAYRDNVFSGRRA